MDASNIGIVTAYNDMLSAHQPYRDYPEQIKAFAREVGCTAQVAGGVPAMCDGVTQGQPGMELSLFSRDVIAQATAVALSHQMFDAAVLLGICDKIVPGLLIGALTFGHLPVVFIPAGPMPSGMSNQEKHRIRQLYSEGKMDRATLLDLLMPEQNGFDVLAEICQHHSDENLPVIAMTADAEPETEARALSSGFKAVLIKPTSDDDLLRALAEALDLTWRYSAEEQGVEADEPTLVLPAAELMESLRVCAQQHDVLGLRKLLSQVEAQPEMAVFAERVQAMVWSYQFSQLINWLDGVAQE